MAQLIKSGPTTPTYDGQNFFDAAHPNPTVGSDGITVTGSGTVSNYQSGTGSRWLLLETKRVLQPFIFQKRRSFQVIPKFALTDERVFWENEFVWGVDGRCNAGFGLWQLAYMSRAALNTDNFLTARNAMASIRRADGSPMGLGTNLMLMVTPDNKATAMALMENENVPAAISVGTPSVGSGGNYAANVVRGMATVLENPWLQ